MKDGLKPAEMHAAAKKDVPAYPSLNATVTAVTGSSDNFELTVADINITYHAQKMIIATGIKDIFPEIEGFAECWGISIYHGCEYREKPEF